MSEALRFTPENINKMYEALAELLILRAETDMTYEDAYYAMFKSKGAWGKAVDAVNAVRGEQ